MVCRILWGQRRRNKNANRPSAAVDAISFALFIGSAIEYVEPGRDHLTEANPCVAGCVRIDQGQFEITQVRANHTSAHSPSDDNTISASDTRGLTRRTSLSGDGSSNAAVLLTSVNLDDLAR
jgi:hypothetical protein